MFSVVHFRCRAAGVRLTKTVSNSFPMSDISVLNVHTIATDVEIIRGSDAQVDRILIDVTMTAPDQKYLDRIQANLDNMGSTITLTVLYLSNLYFGCPKSHVRIRIPPAKQLDEIYVSAKSGNIQLKSIFSAQVDLETDLGDITVTDFIDPGHEEPATQSFFVKSNTGDIYLHSIASSTDLRARAMNGHITTRDLYFYKRDTLQFPELVLETYTGSVKVNKYNGFGLRGIVLNKGNIDITLSRLFLGEFDLRVDRAGGVTVNDTIVSKQIEYYIQSQNEKKGIVSQGEVHRDIQFVQYYANSGKINLEFV